MNDYPVGTEIVWTSSFHKGLHRDGRIVLGKVIESQPGRWVIKWADGKIGVFDAMNWVRKPTSQDKVMIAMQDDPHMFPATVWDAQGGALWMSADAWSVVLEALRMYAQHYGSPVLGGHLADGISMLCDLIEEEGKTD